MVRKSTLLHRRDETVKTHRHEMDHINITVHEMIPSGLVGRSSRHRRGSTIDLDSECCLIMTRQGQNRGFLLPTAMITMAQQIVGRVAIPINNPIVASHLIITNMLDDRFNER